MPSHRRGFLAGLTALVATEALAQAPAVSRITAYGFTFTGIHGGTIRLADYAGKPILVVNTASLCGFTPQYSGLQQLWTRFHDRGLMMIGVPSNDFGGQEPGTSADIMETAGHGYGVTFPLTEKAEVKGRNPHPFYKWAATERPLETPRWNFHKYLIGRDGRIAAAFGTMTDPLAPQVVAAIERELQSGS
jgi:glutathione peroxidase